MLGVEEYFGIEGDSRVVRQLVDGQDTNGSIVRSKITEEYRQGNGWSEYNWFHSMDQR